MIGSDYELYKRAAKKFQIEMPDLWKIVFPRHYVPPSGFPSPRIAGAAIASQLFMGDELSHLQYNKTMIDCMLCAWKLVEQDVPTFFVGNDFITALAESEPPRDLYLDNDEELKWPHDAMIFMLPERFQKNYFKRPVPFVAVAKTRTGLSAPPPIVRSMFPRTNTVGLEQPGAFSYIFYSCVFFGGKPVDYAGSWPLHATVGEILDKPIFINSFDDRGEYLPQDQMPTEAEDGEILIKMFCVSLWLLMAMNAEPQWIERHTVSCHRKAAKASNESRDLWYPNFLGRTYTLPQEPLGGTHASPRLHPRRAHWTHQPHGPKSSLRRLQWIRRTFVGANL